MYNMETDALQISDSFRKSPFAQGYNDGYQLGLYDNPFDGDDEVEWWKEYVMGFAFAEERKAARTEAWSNMF